MTMRVLPPSAAAKTTAANGRTYTCAAASYLDVPDQDAAILEANGWIIVVHMGVGTTAQRPTTGLQMGKRYLDTTLGYTIRYTGKSWVNPANGNVV